jgi:hypothetical protein
MTWTDVFLATLAGGVVLFIWGAICWIALPHHHGDYRAFPKADEDAVTRALEATRAGPGMYAVPHFANYGGMKDPALNERYQRGPNATVVLTPPGPCMQGSTFLKGFVLDLAAAFAAAVILRYVNPGIEGTPRRVLFFAGIGALVAGFPAFQQVIWMKGPVRNAVTATFDGIVGFALVGLTYELLF